MWILGSTLSISQRSLSAEQPGSERQRCARELAHRLIESYSSRPAVREALDFVNNVSRLDTGSDQDGLHFTLSSDPLAPLCLPEHCGVKGGAAREALAVALQLRDFRAPRDVDLVRRGSHRCSTDEQLASRIMPRDFMHGARVELVRNLSSYFMSRDLTINEVICIDGTVSASLLCVLDSLGQVIRPSRYRGGTLHRKPSLHGQSLLKMVRLFAEGSCLGEGWMITGIPEEVSFSEFDLALHLNKAFQRGRPVAERFLHTCTILSLLAASEDPIREVLEELEHLRHGERGLLPDVPAEEWRFLD